MFVLWFCVFLGAGLSAPVRADETNQLAAVERSAHLLGGGDTIKILVFGEEDLSGDYTLDADGRIAMPLIGDVDLLGRSLAEARDLITQRYKNGYLNNPGITVDIATFRPFYILGEVNAPGEYEYRANMSVLNAVAKAGGFTYRANRNEAKLQMPTPNEDVIETDIPMGRIVQPGDIIMIKERFF